MSWKPLGIHITGGFYTFLHNCLKLPRVHNLPKFRADIFWPSAELALNNPPLLSEILGTLQYWIKFK